MSRSLASLRGVMLALLVLCGLTPVTAAAELVMFERAGCPWCRNWDREIAAIYPKTREGVKAPLRRVSLDKPLASEWKLDPPVFYSPTFVVIDKGREIGRITGYSNAESFWGLLGAILARTGQTPTP
ncbi:MAG: thioredoxin family protein [Beijerinckiaceae bacterium]|nr:thioredoxin family protein [Beijerinckiaceae bacterium]